MLNAESLIIHTRMSDLDSQRHINNASYLNFITEAQYKIMQHAGYDFQYILDKGIRLEPEYIHVKFFRQQISDVALKIETRAANSNRAIIWFQDIFNSEKNELACSFQSVSRINNPDILRSLPVAEIQPQGYSLPDFEGHCKRSRLTYEIRHIDLNAFNECSQAVLWRLNEEARWSFFREAGVPFEALMEKDLSLFWMEGAYRYHGDIGLGDSLEVYTWVNRFDRARIYLNHEILCQGKRVLITEGEFISVSLSRSRVVRVPDYLIKAITPFTDQAAQS